MSSIEMQRLERQVEQQKRRIEELVRDLDARERRIEELEGDLAEAKAEVLRKEDGLKRDGSVSEWMERVPDSAALDREDRYQLWCVRLEKELLNDAK